ncbi:MAG: SagB/ThcOx family dehydrogenase [Thioalkalivibrio sp.]|nr:MAG: SagB/ThcOx family dehydrogenase [Thioalkalivibrio sp.]
MMLSMASVSAQGGTSPGQGSSIALPEPKRTGEVSIEATLDQRRSVRSYDSAALSLEEIAQLAWAAQGVTEPQDELRTAPSAGGTFPLEIDLLVAGSDDLEDGVYRYQPREHSLVQRIAGDRRSDLHDAGLGQTAILEAPVVMVMSGVVSRTARRYGPRAERYVHMEAGHAAQNVYLQGNAMDIGTVVIGAFRDEAVSSALELNRGEQPLYLMPLGRMR